MFSLTHTATFSTVHFQEVAVVSKRIQEDTVASQRREIPLINLSATDVAMSYHRSAMTMTFPQQRAPYRFNLRKHSCCIGMENTFQIFPLLRFSWFSCPAQLTDVIELIHDKAQAFKIAKHYWKHYWIYVFD